MPDLDLQGLYWASEVQRCETDLPYLMAKFLRIRGKSEIGFIPVSPNRVQMYAIRKFKEQQDEIGMVRYVVGKARQVTFTTLCRALAIQQTAFANDRAAIMVAHDEDTSKAVFGVDRFFYDHLDPRIRPARAKDTVIDMAYPSRRSLSLARHAANLNVGAASAYHYMHLTEASRFKKPREIQGSLFPTLADAPGSYGIIESTSVVGGSWYYQFAESARAGEQGPWRFMFIPWYWHAEYQAPVPPKFSLTLEEKNLQKQYSLTREQLAWRRIKKQEYRAYPALMESEFSSSWEASWVLPEGAMRVFQDEGLLELRKGLRAGSWMRPTSEGLKPGLGSPLTVWELPQQDVFYHMGVDPSGGDTSNEKEPDWSVACVVRRDNLEQVAQLRVRMSPASQEFIDLIYWLGMSYNNAQINPDVTGGWGVALLAELQRRDYHNLWRWRRRLDARERETQQVGFYANIRDKEFMVHLCAGMVERQEVQIHSEQLFDEMVSYLATGLHQWGGHPFDDCVFSWMLAILAAHDAGDRVPMTSAPPPDPAEEFALRLEREPWKYQDVMGDLADTHPVLINLEPWR